MRRASVALQVGVVALAAGLLLLPLPAGVVEQYYADWFYPSLQSQLTSWSNTSAISLFDVLLAVSGGALLIALVNGARCSWRARSVRPISRTLAIVAVCAAAGYLWFAAAWGLNYARPPLELSIEYDSTRVTPAAVRMLAAHAVTEVNTLYSEAHAAGFPEIGDMPPALVRSFHTIERHLGRPRPTTPGRPKKTLLATFFRASGVDGMHAPFLLETLLNPDLTPPERPAVLAHEWAHLAGYAPEDDASFVGLLAALHADRASRYSAWLALFEEAAGQLPVTDRRALLEQLSPGPQSDRRAIRDRLTKRVDVIARASWQTYDHYLKAQGVQEGVQSYSRVVQLLLGTRRFEESLWQRRAS